MTGDISPQNVASSFSAPLNPEPGSGGVWWGKLAYIFQFDAKTGKWINPGLRIQDPITREWSDAAPHDSQPRP